VANVPAAINACPEQTEDEFNFGLTKRKAIYLPHEGCYPPTCHRLEELHQVRKCVEQ